MALHRSNPLVLGACRGDFALVGGALWDLFARSEELKSEGRDFLDEQAADLDDLARALREEMATLEDSDLA
jgi:hypothetical protein